MGSRWKCPNCGTILEKSNPDLEAQVRRGVMVAGRVTCGNCRRVYSAGDVYGGLYDLDGGRSGEKPWWQFWK